MFPGGCLRRAGRSSQPSKHVPGARFRHSRAIGKEPQVRIIERTGPSPGPEVRMATLRFLLKRFVAQRLLGLAVVVTLAFSVAVLVAGPIYADAAREAILSSRARRRSPDRAERATPGLRRRELRLGGGGRGHHRADRVAAHRTGSSARAWARSGSGHAGRSVRAAPRPRRDRGSPRDPRRPPGRGRRSSCTSAMARQRSRVRRGDRIDDHRSDRRALELVVTGTYSTPGSRRPLLVRLAEPVPRSGPTTGPHPAATGQSLDTLGPRHAESWS